MPPKYIFVVLYVLLNVDGVNKTACQGNWWPSGITGVGNISAVGGDEKIIGKKSSVNPDKPVFD